MSSRIKEIKKRDLKEKMRAKKSVLKLENTEPKEMYKQSKEIEKNMEKRKEEMFRKYKKMEKRMKKLARKFKKIKQNKKETSSKLKEMKKSGLEVKNAANNEWLTSNKKVFSNQDPTCDPSEKRKRLNLVKSKRRNDILPEGLQGMFTEDIKPDTTESMATEPLRHTEMFTCAGCGKIYKTKNEHRVKRKQ